MNTRNGEYLRLSTIGYAAITVCSLFLGLSIIEASSEFSFASRFLGEFILAILIFIGYIGNYPQLSPAGEHGDELWKVKMASALIAFGIISGYLRPAFEDFIIKEISVQLEIIPPIIAIISIHFFILEGLLGFRELPERADADILNRFQRPWEIRTSIFIITLTLFLLTLWTHHVAQTSTGPNPGYYAIFGLLWAQFILGHWIISAVLFSYPVIIRNELGMVAKRIAQAIALGIVVFIVIEAIFFIPNGVLVIPL